MPHSLMFVLKLANYDCIRIIFRSICQYCVITPIAKNMDHLLILINGLDRTILHGTVREKSLILDMYVIWDNTNRLHQEYLAMICTKQIVGTVNVCCILGSIGTSKSKCLISTSSGWSRCSTGLLASGGNSRRCDTLSHDR